MQQHNILFDRNSHQKACLWNSLKPLAANPESHLTRYQISKGITYVSSHFYVNQPVSIKINYEYPSVILAYCQKGQHTLSLNHNLNAYTIREGDIWLINLNDTALIRQLLPDVAIDMKLLKYDMRHLQDFLDADILQVLNTSFIMQVNKALYCDKWLKFFSKCHTQNFKGRLLAESKALEILANTLHSISLDKDILILLSQKKHKDIADNIADWIINCTDSVPTLKDIEQAFNMSHTKLGTIFKNEKGISVFTFYREIRLQRALKLLQNKSISITDIAQICRFSSSSHLTSAFKRAYQVTPSQYRKKL